jgi:hypothetical protein
MTLCSLGRQIQCQSFSSEAHSLLINLVNMAASHRNPSAPSGANQYKANVNRTKTRKWVEAKTVDYGGDDWGGDYDDEPYEPEAQPQPQPKPQGPRSSATLSNNQPPSPAGPRALQTTGLAARAASPASSSSPGFRTPVGAPALHIQTQQHPSTKPTTIDTGSPWRQGPPSRGSTPGIERPREISPHAVGVPQSATASSVYSAVAEFGQLYGDRAASPGPFQGPRPRRMSPGPQSVSSPVPTRFPRRKSSLGQQDAPADTVYSPTHADSNRQTGSRPGSSHTNPGSIVSANKPWMVEGTVGGPRSASPSGSMRSPTATGKPLPFVRPADIYKKLEDEKDKVRRSIDSGRPSMDSLGLGRGSDTAGSLRAQSPAGTSRNKPPTQDQAQVRPDSDVISPGLAGVTDVPFTEEVQVDSNGRKGTTPGRDDDDSIVPRSGRPGLPTVAERKSEYGIEGLIASYEARGSTSDGTSQPDASPLATTAESTSVPASREGVPAMSSATSRLSPRNEIGDDQADQGHQAREVTRLEKKEGAAREQALGSAHSQEKDAEQAQKGEELEDIKKGQSGEELRRLSRSPKLPELGRLSVFGFDLFSSSTSSNPPNPSSSFNLPTSSPPPPVPAIPSSHSIVSPGSPLSTVIESPSPSSSLPNQDDRLDQAQEVQGQAPRDQTWPDVDSRSQLPAPSHAISQPNYSGAGSTSRVPLSEHSSLRQSESSPDQHHYPSGESDPNSRPISAGQGARAQSSERPEPIVESVTNLHATSDTLTSKSESEQQPSEYKALPTLPSEASVVTPDPQASQLAISGPTAIGSDEHGSSEGESSNASSTANPKLAIHPLLAQHSGQAKAIPPQVSASSSSHATSASVPSPAPASKLTPVDNQVLPPPRLPGPLVTDYQSYLPSSSSDTAAVPSIQSADKGPSEESDVGSPVPKGQLTEGTVAGNASGTRVSPPQPSGTPPPPPVEITRGETYVTALESASQLEGGGSPLKSDKLSAEILRSLSPAAPNATTVAETSDAANRSSDGPSSAARESSFLPDLYDDYWSFAGEGNDTDPNDTPGVPTNPASDAMPAALNVQTDDSRPRSPVIENNVNVRSVSFVTPAHLCRFQLTLTADPGSISTCGNTSFVRGRL